MARVDYLSNEEESLNLKSDEQLTHSFLADVSANNGYEHLDLSEVSIDPSSLLHSLEYLHFNRPEAMMSIRVFDLSNVSITSEAKLAINRAHFQPLYFVEAYANSYREKLFRELSRGKDKGLCVLEKSASRYQYVLSNGQVVVAQVETVEVESKFTRRLMISLKPSTTMEKAA